MKDGKHLSGKQFVSMTILETRAESKGNIISMRSSWEQAEGIFSFSLKSVFNTRRGIRQRDSCSSLETLIAHSTNNCYVSAICRDTQRYTHSLMTNMDRTQNHLLIIDRQVGRPGSGVIFLVILQNTYSFK